MYTNRLFNLIVAAIVVAVVALAVQQAFATKAIVPETGGAYTESSEQVLREYQLGERYGVTPQDYASDQDASDFYQQHPDWMWGIKDQNASIPVTGDSAFPDYYQRHPELSVPAEISADLTDYFFRHLAGNIPSLVALFSSEQIRREYILGEWYGVTPQGYTEQQALREYWLGERYGQLPSK